MNLSVLIKPASSMCNMRCRYCFYHDEAVSRGVYFYGTMTEATAENLIRKALEFADGDSVAFAFQGGEPLLAGMEYFRFFTRRTKELNAKNSPVYFSAQTNGTLVTDEWARFFAENRFLVGLSLDGDFDRNKFRVSPAGNNEYYKITQAAAKLKKAGAEFNILTVLTGFCADNAEKIYDHFKKLGFGYLQFIPCLRPYGDETESELFMTPDQYADFLIRVFGRYAKDFARGNYVSIRQFDNWVRMYNGEQPEQCGLSGRCARQYVCEGNGNLYPCDFYCTDEYLLGNVNETDFAALDGSEKAKSFVRESLRIPEKCRACPYYFLCRAGGCRRLRESADYCAAYKKFFSQCLPLFRIFGKPQR